MTGWLIGTAILATICGMNFYLGWTWSRLDHNPWAGKFLSGNFSGPAPGWNAGKLDVAEIRSYGRTMMIAAPILFCVGTIVIALVMRWGAGS